jgi:hypothetical protein
VGIMMVLQILRAYSPPLLELFLLTWQCILIKSFYCDKDIQLEHLYDVPEPNIFYKSLQYTFHGITAYTWYHTNAHATFHIMRSVFPPHWKYEAAWNKKSDELLSIFSRFINCSSYCIFIKPFIIHWNPHLMFLSPRFSFI